MRGWANSSPQADGDAQGLEDGHHVAEEHHLAQDRGGDRARSGEVGRDRARSGENERDRARSGESGHLGRAVGARVVGLEWLKRHAPQLRPRQLRVAARRRAGEARVDRGRGARGEGNVDGPLQPGREKGGGVMRDRCGCGVVLKEQGGRGEAPRAGGARTWGRADVAAAAAARAGAERAR